MANYGNQRGSIISGIFPPAIKWLIIINVAVFLFQVFFLNFFTIGGEPLGNWVTNIFALQPIFTGDYGSFSFHHFWIWQLLTYQFLHGGWWHLFFNMFSLWMFGIELERLWGSKRFIIYYLLCGIGAGLCQLFVSPLFGPTAPTIGASGAIYGVLLGFGMTFPNRPIFMFPLFIPIPAKIFVIIFAGIELYSGLSPAQDGVAHFAHLGGALFGLLLILFGDKTHLMPFLEKLLSGKKKPSSTRDFYSQSSFTKASDRPNATNPSFFQPRWQKPKDTPPPRRMYEIEDDDEDLKSKKRPNTTSGFFIEGEEITQHKIDEILDKISEYGYQSLTEREKKILLELSKKL
ncbi:MAG TPA: rhomboid family intramembrane serine protease [Candidatus Kapabacteria bacterium]|jgi:membrane associated rhomboid family serine protease|nr:rhomboid family intramembrane serine protease [Candidatus Kapabacteria bacterium]HOV91888.1 rhomboid family intramembrane serine protease [Candidatus Kapabacteria bacterium]